MYSSCILYFFKRKTKTLTFFLESQDRPIHFLIIIMKMKMKIAKNDRTKTKDLSEGLEEKVFLSLPILKGRVFSIRWSSSLGAACCFLGLFVFLISCSLIEGVELRPLVFRLLFWTLFFKLWFATDLCPLKYIMY